MHQHQLLSFATKFGFFHIPRTSPASQPPSFTDTTQVRYTDLLCLSPVKKKDRNLNLGQRRHLQEHYKTHYEISNFQDPDLANMDDKVQVWTVASMSERYDNVSLCGIPKVQFYSHESSGLHRAAG
jgi:hypothetical protein